MFPGFPLLSFVPFVVKVLCSDFSFPLRLRGALLVFPITRDVGDPGDLTPPPPIRQLGFQSTYASHPSRSQIGVGLSDQASIP